MSGANRSDDARGVHEGEATGRVQSPSHHLAGSVSPPGLAPALDADLLQDPAGYPAVGAAEDKSGRHPSTRASTD